METIVLDSWGDFFEAVDRVGLKYGVYRAELGNGEEFVRKVPVLYRGQGDSSWHLHTTLERKTPIHIASWNMRD
jgi:hypothetical protein